MKTPEELAPRYGAKDPAWHRTKYEPQRLTHLFRVNGCGVCHIQQMPDGQYGFNGNTFGEPAWYGPVFDSLEACVLWLKMVGEL